MTTIDIFVLIMAVIGIFCWMAYEVINAPFDPSDNDDDYIDIDKFRKQ